MCLTATFGKDDPKTFPPLYRDLVLPVLPNPTLSRKTTKDIHLRRDIYGNLPALATCPKFYSPSNQWIIVFAVDENSYRFFLLCSNIVQENIDTRALGYENIGLLYRELGFSLKCERVEPSVRTRQLPNQDITEKSSFQDFTENLRVAAYLRVAEILVLWRHKWSFTHWRQNTVCPCSEATPNLP
jgi:hypothetical protein